MQATRRKFVIIFLIAGCSSGEHNKISIVSAGRTTIRIVLREKTNIELISLSIYIHTCAPTHPPIQLAFMTDRMVWDTATGWLVAHRKFQPSFEGGTPTTNPELDQAGAGDARA